MAEGGQIGDQVEGQNQNQNRDVNRNVSYHDILMEARSRYPNAGLVWGSVVVLQDVLDYPLDPNPDFDYSSPPIYLVDIADVDGLITVIDSVAEGHYIMTLHKNNYIKVQVLDSSKFVPLLFLLRRKRLEFYSFQRDQDKPYKVYLRNIPHTVSTIDIADELFGLNHNVIRISNIVLRKTKEPLPLFLVELERRENNRQIFQVTRLLDTDVVFERPRKRKTPTQCTRCQYFGHTKNYCNMNPRCVKCIGKHFTADCPRTEKDANVQCCNCKSNHTANYRGCRIYRKLVHEYARGRRTISPPSPDSSYCPSPLPSSSESGSTMSSDDEFEIDFNYEPGGVTMSPESPPHSPEPPTPPYVRPPLSAEHEEAIKAFEMLREDARTSNIDYFMEAMEALYKSVRKEGENKDYSLPFNPKHYSPDNNDLINSTSSNSNKGDSYLNSNPGDNTPDKGSQGDNVPDNSNQGDNAPDNSNQGGNTPDNSNQGDDAQNNSNPGNNTPDNSNQGDNNLFNGNQGGDNPGNNSPHYSIPGNNTPDNSNQGNNTPDNSNQAGNIPDNSDSSDNTLYNITPGNNILQNGKPVTSNRFRLNRDNDTAESSISSPYSLVTEDWLSFNFTPDSSNPGNNTPDISNLGGNTPESSISSLYSADPDNNSNSGNNTPDNRNQDDNAPDNRNPDNDNLGNRNQDNTQLENKA